MSGYYDVIVVGAGPAGLAAAATLAEMGLQVMTLDEQHRVGGQIYRAIETASPDTLKEMGEDYRQGSELAGRFRRSGAGYLGGAMAWQVEPDGSVCYSHKGQSHQIRASYLVIATGAMERPVPFPGWNLPGVMGAGAANNLAKEAGLTPEGPVVLAGSGPLLLLEADLLLAKGVQLAAVLETTPKFPALPAFRYLPAALRRSDFLLKGMSMVGRLRKSATPYFQGVAKITAVGSEKLEAVEAETNGRKLHYPAELLLCHFGVIPNTHIFRLIGCHMAWEPEQHYWYPTCDQWGQTNFERIFTAGDGAGVRGAVAAALRGERTALEIARRIGIIPEYERDALAGPIWQKLRHDEFPRPFIDAVFAPTITGSMFEDDTVLCRCENISVGDVRRAVREGVREVNEVKIVTRCGMGPCQGRMCGPALAEVMGAEMSLRPDKVGLLTVRPPLKPISLAEVAEMDLLSAAAGPADLFKNQGKK